jgi:cell division transport system permease protein
VEIVAYLQEGERRSRSPVMRQEIGALPEVLQTRYVSKTEALAMAVQDLEEFREVFSDLEVNPLPASIEIRMREGHRNPDLGGACGRPPARPTPSWTTSATDASGSRRSSPSAASRPAATALIGGAFAAVAGIIIATAVRLAVFARREEIAIMRLVGATNGFIQSPFLIEGLMAGLLGGILAVVLTYAASTSSRRRSSR